MQVKLGKKIHKFLKKNSLILIAAFLIVFFLVFLLLFKKQTPKIISLTDKNSGGTIHLRVNDSVTISVKAPQGMNVATGVSDPKVLRLNKNNSGQGVYAGSLTATNPGETDVITTASPACDKGGFCMPLQVLIFKQHVIVNK